MGPTSKGRGEKEGEGREKGSPHFFVQVYAIDKNICLLIIRLQTVNAIFTS